MWRALFGAIGLTLCIVGGELMLIDEAVLESDIGLKLPSRNDGLEFGSYDQGTSLDFMHLGESLSDRRIAPPDWAPWSFLSVGGVIVLYALGLRATPKEE